MDNNELDKILKEKLKTDIKPSQEFENKIKQKIEEEKLKFKAQEFKEPQKPQKQINRLKYFSRILSIAAVLVIVFAVGINLKDTPLLNNEEKNNLLSISAIEPTKLQGGILDNNSEFIIKAEGKNLSVQDIQKSIYIEPALEYTIEKTSNPNEYKLKFKQNIPDNTILKLQYVKNQITQDSWAYQTSNKLSITKTYPENNSQDVSKNTAIDIEFSYASVENFEKYVNIEPSVDGNWNHIGNIWRFTPNKELEEKQYKVTVKRGIKAEDETLEDNYEFKFYVGETSFPDIQYKTISIDGITTITPDENVKIYYTNSINTKGKFGNSRIYKFQNIDEFSKYLETKNSENLNDLGEFETENYRTSESDGYIKITNKLEKGFYLVNVIDNTGKELFKIPVQVTDISSYFMETERDVIVWVANNLASNISVNYQGKTVKTDNQGIAKFENIADGSEKIKYAKVENELVLGIYNYGLKNYPNSYIYTDRPLYKNTDTINIWGFVPRKLFTDKIEEDFYIQLGDEQKQKVNVDKDGNFKYKLELKNHLNDEYTAISLYYKDAQIANKVISIQNYELQNYTYEVITEKKYAKEGEKVNFDVKVKHITGLIVPNKKVTIKTGENNIETKLTENDGIAHFEIQLDKAENEDTSDLMYKTIEIFNGDENEYNLSETEYTIAVLKRNTHTVFDETETGKIKATLYKLDDTRNVDTLSWDMNELYNGPYETEVNIYLREDAQHKEIEEYVYNEYTKENEPRYYYGETEENIIKVKTVKSDNGKVEVNYDELKTKEDTEDTVYTYYIEFEYKDQDGKIVKDFTYYFKNHDIYMQNKNSIGYNGENIGEESYDRLGEIEEKSINIDFEYNMYRYFFKHDNKSYKIGENIELKLSESTKEGTKEIENQGKLLITVFKENITEYKIITEDSYVHEFTEKDFPGCKITASYFIDGKFYRMPVDYFDFDEDTRKVDIEITSDKNEYKPGDEVNLKIKTTNNEKPVKTNVNISVVNESVFKVQGDTTNLIEQIYTSKMYAAYTYSSYKDTLDAFGGGGGGGGDGSVRSNFSDTTYFDSVSTNNNGEAEVKFKLPDNVTTYRITAHSTNPDLYLGVETKNITSKLEFFIQSTEPRGIKQDDDVVLNATSIADEKYEVNYEFSIKELNKALTATGTTNNIATVNFGKLPIGEYTAIIKGQHGDKEDAIEYKFNVVNTVQEIAKKTTADINKQAKITPSKNPIKLEIYSKDMSKYMEYIDFIESTISERLDTQITYNKIQEFKEKYYGTPYTINQIKTSLYMDEGRLKNLRNGNKDLVLTALARYYAHITPNEYGAEATLSKDDNIFEYYLLKAAENKPVLNDLLYLKEEQDTDNYNKLLVTLSLEFAGDFQNAKDLYRNINLSQDEQEKYKSIIAIIETFINKKEVTSKIDKIIEENPSDEYIRFAIISYFENNSIELETKETVKITAKNLEETFEINPMQVKTYTINDEDLNTINFETDSNSLMVSYYYQTPIENIEEENIVKDITLKSKGEFKKSNTIKLLVSFGENSDYEGEVRIALPNSLRLAKNYNSYDIDSKYYVQSNNIDYITIYKMKECKSIILPLLVTNEGNYKFESIVCKAENTYHISEPFELNIE